MPCYHPLEGWRKQGGGITFKLSEALIGRPLLVVPCGQCIGCRLERSRQWAIRCMHESTLHDQNCFITLTYANDRMNHLPKSVDPDTGEIGPGSLHGLVKRDIQLFFKSLRKEISPRKVRYLQCGEYGTESFRPHHHALLFGYDFPDKYYWSRNAKTGDRYFRSDLLEWLWPHGNSLIGDLTFESAAYVARYCVGKITGKFADFHYCGLKPEFITMSLKPGIAHDWIVNNMDSVYPNDRVYVRAGVTSKPPKYYDKVYDLKKEDFWKIRGKRVMKARKLPIQSVRRLMDREVCHELRASRLVRTLS